ncbi:hypothetical protein [Rhizobium sp. Root491]|uniref:hypothetical protein n=1 Tax=Rhizobium sp. Root491 TaxID=1736548 RepID=UPI0012E3EBD3|nr:hypothetical protein [Rhizobium sp. Root491]
MTAYLKNLELLCPIMNNFNPFTIGLRSWAAIVGRKRHARYDAIVSTIPVTADISVTSPSRVTSMPARVSADTMRSVCSLSRCVALARLAHATGSSIQPVFERRTLPCVLRAGSFAASMMMARAAAASARRLVRSDGALSTIWFGKTWFWAASDGEYPSPGLKRPSNGSSQNHGHCSSLLNALQKSRRGCQPNVSGFFYAHLTT